VIDREKVEKDYESLQDRLRTLPDKLSYDIMVWHHISFTNASNLCVSTYAKYFACLINKMSNYHQRIIQSF